MTEDRMRHLLDAVAAGVPPSPPAADDLARAKAAARTRSRRRFRAGLAALSVVAVAGVGVTLATRPGPEPAPTTSTASDITLLAMPLQADPYTFDLTPQGWSVQGQSPQAVTIVPDDGSTSANPDDFVGKLVILFDRNPLHGQQTSYDGRTIWITGDTGYTTLSMPTAAGEPEGVVRIQYPDSAGWSREAMVRFLASVHVGPGAEPGVG